MGIHIRDMRKWGMVILEPWVYFIPVIVIVKQAAMNFVCRWFTLSGDDYASDSFHMAIHCNL